ncbi:hypothetical protein OAN21_01625 [Alphaproteobacteria bacterium]|nr:hypothetical protein [Alphaproteobacteria bacterium]
MRISFSLFILYLFLASTSESKKLGYCPKDSVQACRASLATSMNIVSNCALGKPRVKECAFILVETLSEVDNKAPFYEGFYEKNFELGDVKNYKKEVTSLHNYSPHAWLVLHNLSKALILNYIDIQSLSPEQKREIENLIQPTFAITEGRNFVLDNKEHRKSFIEKQLARARAIQWGAPKEKTILQ